MPIIQNKSLREVCLITEPRLKHRTSLSMSRGLSSMSKPPLCQDSRPGREKPGNAHLMDGIPGEGAIDKL